MYKIVLYSTISEHVPWWCRVPTKSDWRIEWLWDDTKYDCTVLCKYSTNFTKILIFIKSLFNLLSFSSNSKCRCLYNTWFARQKSIDQSFKYNQIFAKISMWHNTKGIATYQEKYEPIKLVFQSMLSINLEQLMVVNLVLS